MRVYVYSVFNFCLMSYVTHLLTMYDLRMWALVQISANKAVIQAASKARKLFGNNNKPDPQNDPISKRMFTVNTNTLIHESIGSEEGASESTQQMVSTYSNINKHGTHNNTFVFVLP